MNILIDRIPTSVKINNRRYRIRTDFRNSIQFDQLMQDDEVSDDDKLPLALNLYYPVIPRDIKKAVKKMLWFYKCGKEKEEIKKSINGKSDKQIFSFEYDAEYIYAAFLDQYGIDLQDIEDLHWWKFKAMFKGLKEDNLISKIIGYRAIDLSKIEDEKEREHYRKLQEFYKLPAKINKDEKEKINEIEKMLMQYK